jgi:uncharacterized protein YndB with AHSA1/START domain
VIAVTKSDATVILDDRSLVVTRPFDAPRERVFEAWTDPEQVDQWWGPNGFTTETDELDIREGGAWRYVMTGPKSSTGEFHTTLGPNGDGNSQTTEAHSARIT